MSSAAAMAHPLDLRRGGRILVFDLGGRLAAQVRRAGEAIEPTPRIVECTQAGALGDLLVQEHFDVLVAGPGLDTRLGMERLRIIREEVPEMALVLAVPSLDALDIRDLVRAGAVDVVETPASSRDLSDALGRALDIADRTARAGLSPAPAPPASAAARRVITIASASGGCGKTFLATNLAWFLTRHGGRRVCIVDLDLQFGEVSSALRLRPRYTITDLIAHVDEEPSRLADHFDEFCETHDTGVHVLAAPRDPYESSLIRPEDVGRVIDAAARIFDDVIVDTPPALADNVVTAFNRSDELLVMATLDVPSVRNMHVFLDTLDRLEIPKDGIRLLLNKAEKHAGVEAHQILKLFPQGFDATLPYSRDVHRALNAGLPVLSCYPGAAISRDVGAALRRFLPAEAQEKYDAEQNQVRTGRLRRRSRRAEGAS